MIVLIAMLKFECHLLELLIPESWRVNARLSYSETSGGSCARGGRQITGWGSRPVEISWTR